MTPRSLRALLALAIVVATVVGAACRADRGPRQAPLAARPASAGDGLLPPGCITVASVDPKALGAMTSVLNAIAPDDLLSQRLPGVDLNRDVQRISYCKAHPGDAKESQAPFIVVVTGRGVAKVFAGLLAEGGDSIRKMEISGLPVVGRAGRWIALRPQGTADGDLLVATSPQLLEAALTGARGAYAVDQASPLSIVVDRRAFPHVARSGFELVRELRLNLSPDLRTLAIRFVALDDSSAETLAPDVRSSMPVLVGQFVGAGGPRVEMKTEVEGSDVVTRLALPANALERLASSVVAARSRIGSNRSSSVASP